MVLREKLKSINMVKGKVVMSYLTRISQVRDELAAIGVVVTGPERVRTTLNGMTQPWAVFVRVWWLKRTYHHGIGSVMILFRRRLRGVSCSTVVLLVERMRRMWL